MTWFWSSLPGRGRCDVERRAPGTEDATKKSAAVMFDLRRIALWIAVLVIPGGLLLLPLVLADFRRKKELPKPTSEPADRDPKTPNDPGSSPGHPDDGTPPRLAA
jgi:hypothetical protein